VEFGERLRVRVVCLEGANGKKWVCVGVLALSYSIDNAGQK